LAKAAQSASSNQSINNSIQARLVQPGESVARRTGRVEISGNGRSADMPETGRRRLLGEIANRFRRWLRAPFLPLSGVVGAGVLSFINPMGVLWAQSPTVVLKPADELMWSVTPT